MTPWLTHILGCATAGQAIAGAVATLAALAVLRRRVPGLTPLRAALLAAPIYVAVVRGGTKPPPPVPATNACVRIPARPTWGGPSTNVLTLVPMGSVEVRQ